MPESNETHAVAEDQGLRSATSQPTFGLDRQDLWALVPFAVGCLIYGWLAWAYGIDRSGDSWNFFQQAWTNYYPGARPTWSTVQPHGYPVLLLLALFLGFNETVAASLINVVAMAGIGAITFLLLRRITSRTAALLAAFALMLSKPFLYVGNWAMPEAPSIFFFALATWLLVLYAARLFSVPRRLCAEPRGLLPLVLVSGFALGLGVWMRYAAAIWLPCGLAWILLCGWFARRRLLALGHALLVAIPGLLFLGYSVLFAMRANDGQIHAEGSGLRLSAIVPVLGSFFHALREDVFGPLVTAYYCHQAADPSWTKLGLAPYLEPISWVLMALTVYVVWYALRRLGKDPALRRTFAPCALFPLLALATPLFLIASCVTTAVELPTARYCTAYYPALYLTLAMAYHIYASHEGSRRRLRRTVTASALALFLLLQVSWTAGYVDRARKGAFVQLKAAGWKKNELVQWCRENLQISDLHQGNESPVIDEMMDYYHPGWLRRRLNIQGGRSLAIYGFYGYPRMDEESVEDLRKMPMEQVLFRTERYAVWPQ